MHRNGARPVLRGGGEGNLTPLPDFHPEIQHVPECLCECLCRVPLDFHPEIQHVPECPSASRAASQIHDSSDLSPALFMIPRWLGCREAKTLYRARSAPARSSNSRASGDIGVIPA